jgi:hypothetical protein
VPANLAAFLGKAVGEIAQDGLCRGYVPNKNCRELGAFEQQGPTWTGILFAKIGLVPQPRYWWDVRAEGK